MISLHDVQSSNLVCGSSTSAMLPGCWTSPTLCKWYASNGYNILQPSYKPISSNININGSSQCPNDPQMRHFQRLSLTKSRRTTSKAVLACVVLRDLSAQDSGNRNSADSAGCKNQKAGYFCRTNPSWNVNETYSITFGWFWMQINIWTTIPSKCWM